MRRLVRTRLRGAPHTSWNQALGRDAWRLRRYVATLRHWKCEQAASCSEDRRSISVTFSFRRECKTRRPSRRLCNWLLFMEDPRRLQFRSRLGFDAVGGQLCIGCTGSPELESFLFALGGWNVRQRLRRHCAIFFICCQNMILFEISRLRRAAAALQSSPDTCLQVRDGLSGWRRTLRHLRASSKPDGENRGN
jgi:hypothetical protein